MIEKKAVLQALKALRSLEENYEASGKKRSLLQEDYDLYLQVTIKKIPKLPSMKRIKVALPHRIIKDTDEVCLIVGDLDKKNKKADIEEDILHYKELLEKQGIKEINEIVTLRQLRTEYKPFEAKQKLLAAYDVFLTDNKITECLPKVLGKHFFKKRKFPIQINIRTSNLKQQIERALSTKVFQITGHGNCCTCEVAYLSMEDSDIVDNIVEMAEKISEQIPGSWNNVMGVYLKTPLSKAIPLYVSYDDPDKVQLEEAKDEDEGEIDELTTFPAMNVKVFKDGRVEVLKIKGGKKEAETEAENKSASESVLAEDAKENTESERNSEERSLEDFHSEKSEISQDGSAEDKKKNKKSKKRKLSERSSECVTSEKNEVSQDSPAEDKKKSKKSKKTKSPDCSLESFTSEKSDFPNDTVSPEKMKKGLKSKKKVQESSLENAISEKNELAEDNVSIEKAKKVLKSKKLQTKECSLEKNELAEDTVSIEKPKKVLKSKKLQAKECSLEKSEFLNDTVPAEKMKKSLKSKRKVQESYLENVISEKKKKKKGKQL